MDTVDMDFIHIEKIALEKMSFAHIEKIVLEKIKFGLRTVIPGSLRDELRISSDWDIISKDIVYQIQGYLLGNKVNTEEWDEEVKIYPATMWEELKRDFAPRWFKRKFPVRYNKDITRHVANNYRVCPHLDVSNREHHIRWLAMEKYHIR